MPMTTVSIDRLFERILREIPERAHVYEYFTKQVREGTAYEGRGVATAAEFDSLPWGQDDTWRSAYWFLRRPPVGFRPLWSQPHEHEYVCVMPHHVTHTVGIWVTNCFMEPRSNIVGLRGQLMPDRPGLPDLPETLYRHVVDTEDEVVAMAIGFIMRRDFELEDD